MTLIRYAGYEDMSQRRWTDKEIKVLAELAGTGMSADKIGEEMGRSRTAVMKAAERHGISLLARTGPRRAA